MIKNQPQIREKQKLDKYIVKTNDGFKEGVSSGPNPIFGTSPNMAIVKHIIWKYSVFFFLLTVLDHLLQLDITLRHRTLQSWDYKYSKAK